MRCIPYRYRLAIWHVNDNPRNSYYLDGNELACTESEKNLGFT